MVTFMVGLATPRKAGGQATLRIATKRSPGTLVPHEKTESMKQSYQHDLSSGIDAGKDVDRMSENVLPERGQLVLHVHGVDQMSCGMCNYFTFNHSVSFIVTVPSIAWVFENQGLVTIFQAMYCE